MTRKECWNRPIMPVKCPVIEPTQEKQEDAPIKVVYCRDCKWRENETPDPTDYCSAGERIDE